MAIVELNPMLTAIHGTVGSTTFRAEQGRQQVYEHVPRIGDSHCGTPRNKALFAHVNRMWHDLDQGFHHWCWELGKKEGIAGYNLFMRDNVKALLSPRPLALPVSPVRSYLPRVEVLDHAFIHGHPPRVEFRTNRLDHPWVDGLVAYLWRVPYQEELRNKVIGHGIPLYVIQGTGDEDPHEWRNEERPGEALRRVRALGNPIDCEWTVQLSAVLAGYWALLVAAGYGLEVAAGSAAMQAIVKSATMEILMIVLGV